MLISSADVAQQLVAELLAGHAVTVTIQARQPTLAEIELRFGTAGHLRAVALAATAHPGPAGGLWRVHRAAGR